MTRAIRPRWLLEELGVPYELVRIDLSSETSDTPEYHKIHPLGRVPAFEEDEGVAFYESAAICAYLADKYIDKGFAPPFGSPLRAKYYQWLFFAMSTMERPVETIYEESVLLPDDQRSSKRLERARREWAQIAPVIERAVSSQEYLVGGAFSAADILIASILAWGRFLGLLDGYPALEAYSKRCASRPAAKRARAD